MVLGTQTIAPNPSKSWSSLPSVGAHWANTAWRTCCFTQGYTHLLKEKKKKEWPQKENCPQSFLFALLSALVETAESPVEQRDDKEFQKKKKEFQ